MASGMTMQHKGFQLIGAIDAGGFEQRLRDILDIAGGQQHVVAAEHAGDDVHHEIVHEAQLQHEQVGGDEPAAKIHRDDEQQAHEFAAVELAALTI